MVDDGIYDWMDMTISHNPSTLPKHCIGQNGAIRKDLLKPAPCALRESCSLKEPEEPIDLITPQKTTSETKYELIDLQ